MSWLGHVYLTKRVNRFVFFKIILCTKNVLWRKKLLKLPGTSNVKITMVLQPSVASVE